MVYYSMHFESYPPEEEPEQKPAYIIMGAPNSGKSTYASEIIRRLKAQEISYTYISPDIVRKNLEMAQYDPSRNGEVWDIVYSQTEEALQSGSLPVVEGLFSKPEFRAHFAEFCRDLGATAITGVVMETPLEVCLERNNLRSPDGDIAQIKVPERVIRETHKQLKLYPPSQAEGFHAIVYEESTSQTF